MITKNPTRSYSVAELHCKMSMSEKKRHSQTNVVINDKAQGKCVVKFSIAIFFTNLLLSFLAVKKTF